MVSTYNRRKQGLQYLQEVLGKVLNNIIADAEFDLELKPLNVYNKIIADHTMQTGEKWPEERLTDEDKIMERKDVQVCFYNYLLPLIKKNTILTFAFSALRLYCKSIDYHQESCQAFDRCC